MKFLPRVLNRPLSSEVKIELLPDCSKDSKEMLVLKLGAPFSKSMPS